MQESGSNLVLMDQQAVVVVPHQRTVNPKIVRNLAWTQIFIGVLCIVDGIACVTYVRGGDGFVAGGLWGGVWILLNGGMGLLSYGNLNHTILNGVYMAGNIIAAIVSLIDGVCIIMVIRYYSYCDMWRNGWGEDRWRMQRLCTNEKAIARALYAPLLFLLVTEVFFAIISAVYCCKNSACCSRHCAQYQNQGIVTVQQPFQYQQISNNNTMVSEQTHYPTYPLQPGVVSNSSPAYTSQTPNNCVYMSSQAHPMQANTVYSTQANMCNVAPPPYEANAL